MLKKETGKDDVHLLPVDLAELKSVRTAAEAFLRFVLCTFRAPGDVIDTTTNSKETRLDVLINNASVFVICTAGLS